MDDTTDARIPVVLGAPDQARPGDVVLAEGGHPAAAAGFATATSGHPPACLCCTARTGAGWALAGLLHGRARGELPWFGRVVAWTRTAAGGAELAHALAHDPVASACFRLSPAGGEARPGRPGPADAA